MLWGNEGSRPVVRKVNRSFGCRRGVRAEKGDGSPRTGFPQNRLDADRFYEAASAPTGSGVLAGVLTKQFIGHFSAASA